MAEAPVKKLSIISLAIPILIELVLRNLMGTVNVFLLSEYSDSAVAAVGVANQVMNVVVIAFNVVCAGTAVVVNQALGGKRYQEASHVAMNALCVALGLGLLVSTVMITCGGTFMVWLGLTPDLLPDGTAFLRTVGGASVLMACTTMIGTLFRCYGNARIPMYVVMFTNVLNILGSWIVIYRPFETPLAGVPGVAAVRVASEAAGVVLAVLLLLRARLGFRLRDMVRFERGQLWRIVSIGFMSGAEGISYTLGQVVTTSFITGLGAAALSAKVYVQNVDYYAYVIGLSIGQATQIIAGHWLGAGQFDKAHRFVNRSHRYVCACNVAFGLLLWLAAPQVIGLFSKDPAVLDIARQLLFIDIFVHMARAFNHTHNYGNRAAGYVGVPAVIAAVSIWTFNVGLGGLLVTLGLGIPGLWIGQAVDEWVRGVATCALWQSRRWERTVVVTQTEETE